MTDAPTTIKVVVYHGSYGCDTGCCGHWVEIADTGEQLGYFDFGHPDYRDNLREWAIEFAQDEVIRRFGAGHTADLDWENSHVSID